MNTALQLAGGNLALILLGATFAVPASLLIAAHWVWTKTFRRSEDGLRVEPRSDPGPW